VARSCAEGGRCIVGDFGPGGGKIIYVNREIRISNINSTIENNLTITTSAPHNLENGDRISITGALPTQLNVASGTVDGILSPTEFDLQLPLGDQDRRSYTYSSGGVIPAASGGWKYLQAAPQGWSGATADPTSTVPTYTALSSLLIDWRMGAGDANTRLLKRQPQNAGVADPFDALAELAPEWYFPSQMEVWAMYKYFARNSTSAAAEGLAPSTYLVLSSDYYNVDYGHLWYVADFAKNRTDNPLEAIGGSTYGNEGGHIRPVRKLWLHTAQTNVAVARTLGIGKKVQIPSVTDEGTPVSIRVLKGSVCAVAAPAKKNRNTFFTLTGGKKPGTCSLKITAPGNYLYWALDQSKTISVR